MLLLLLATVGGMGWRLQHGHRQSQPEPGAELQTMPTGNTPPTPPVSVTRATGDADVHAAANPPTGVPAVTNPQERPAWAIAYGAEFWRTSSKPSTTASTDTNPAPAFDVAEVVERVTHAFRAAKDGAVPQAQAGTYTARFDQGAGLGFSPHRPATDHPMRPQPDPDTEAWFRTVAVTRDGQTLFRAGRDATRSSLVGNTAQELLNEPLGMVAHYEALAHGVQVTWVLAEAPAGTGALLVESALSGLRYAGQAEHGLHFADASGVARVRVGSVTAVDAAGERWALAMSATGDQLQVEVPAEILAQASYPLAIDPALEAEFEMDKRLFVSESASQQSPAVAGTSGGYLVVWQRRRAAWMNSSSARG